MIEIGVVSNAHGLDGWLKVHSHCDPPEQLLNYSPLIIRGQSYEQVRGKRGGKSLLIRLDGVEDRTAAEAMIGARIEIERAQLPPADDDSFYHVDLIGLNVVGREDTALGVVDRVLVTGANDVLVIRHESGAEVLIPFVMGQYVESVDLDGGVMRVDWDPDWG